MKLINSLDEETSKYIPDEVFETIEDGKETILLLVDQYNSKEGPFVYPIIKNKFNIKEVEGICLTNNKASIKVLEKYDFIKVFEGKDIYQEI